MKCGRPFRRQQRVEIAQSLGWGQRHPWPRDACVLVTVLPQRGQRTISGLRPALGRYPPAVLRRAALRRPTCEYRALSGIVLRSQEGLKSTICLKFCLTLAILLVVKEGGGLGRRLPFSSYWRFHHSLITMVPKNETTFTKRRIFKSPPAARRN